MSASRSRVGGVGRLMIIESSFIKEKINVLFQSRETSVMGLLFRNQHKIITLRDPGKAVAHQLPQAALQFIPVDGLLADPRRYDNGTARPGKIIGKYLHGQERRKKRTPFVHYTLNPGVAAQTMTCREHR